MKNKIYAIMDNTSSDLYDIYWDQYTDDEKIILLGNREYKGCNDDIISSIETAFNEYDDCINNNSIKYYYNNVTTLLNTYLKKKNNKKWNTREVAAFKKCYTDWLNTYESQRADLYARILSVYFNEKMKVTTLTGYSQGESIDAVIPADTPQDFINDLEALCWGGGCEVTSIITESAADAKKYKKNISKIFENSDCCFFTGKWRIDDIKKAILENYSDDYTIDDIILYETKSKQVTVYDYEEVK